jgi:hypothetical protein
MGSGPCNHVEDDHCSAELQFFGDPQTIRLVLSAIAECFSQYSFHQETPFSLSNQLVETATGQ